MQMTKPQTMSYGLNDSPVRAMRLDRGKVSYLERLWW